MEIAKWTFATLIAEPVTVQCPLLFVQEGMDITTLVHWERLLTGAAQKKVTAGGAILAESIQPAKLNTPACAANRNRENGAGGGESDGQEVRIKYATLLRKEPNFSAPVLATFTIGTKVMVINQSRDWFEVKSHHNGPSGYIRKEFTIPVDVAVYR